MPKKMSISELKKLLYRMDQVEIIELICRLYKASPDVVNILCAEMGDNGYEEALLEESRKKIRSQFFTARGMGKLSLTTAKKVISDFKKASTSADGVIELQIYYVECCTEFTNTYGDLYDSFYNSLMNVFCAAVKGLNKENSPELFSKYYPRLKQIVEDLRDVGYGVYDYLREVLNEELNWSEDTI